MKTTILLTLALVALPLAFVPTAAAEFVPECTPSGGGSLVNQVQWRADCWVDKAQAAAYQIYCDLACP